MIYIFDIDSTIADNEHRAHFIQPAPDGRIHQHQWDAFLDPELVALDAPIPGALAFVQRLQEQNLYYRFLTGRNASLRAVTQKWLVTHGFVHKHDIRPLSMREVGDRSTASSYKEKVAIDLYDRHGPNSLMFFDDDTHVLPVLSRYGLALKAPECWDILVHAHPTDPEPAMKR